MVGVGCSVTLGVGLGVSVTLGVGVGSAVGVGVGVITGLSGDKSHVNFATAPPNAW